MPIYFGNKNISEISFGDKSIAEVYYGDKLVFQKNQFTGGLYTVAGSNVEVVLNPGSWVAVTRGAGGAGGDTHNGSVGDPVGSQGKGGAGGKGELTFYPFTLQYLSKVLVHVGEAGLTKANGGNGGNSGTSGSRDNHGVTGGASCGGGGGGKPSYVADSYTRTTENLYGYMSGTTSISVSIRSEVMFDEKTTVSFSRNPSGDYVKNGVQYYKWVYNKNGNGIESIGDISSEGDTTSLTLVKGDVLLNVVTKIVGASPTSGFPKDYTFKEGNKSIIAAGGGGDIIFTDTEEPSVGDIVYSDWDMFAGTINTIREDGVVLLLASSKEYIRYSEADKDRTIIAPTHILTYADGGGGGGAGGQQGNNGRYESGSGGGAGGGYYSINTNGVITNHPGQPGPGGFKSGHEGGGNPGLNGNAVIAVTAGNGGGGYREGGGAGGTGGGASGGASGAGKRNDDDHRKRASGGGGGGAGGSLDAGGGQGGTGGAFALATDGYNYHTTPTDTLADNIKYAGVNDTYGIGGTTSTNGTGGFVLIKKVCTLTVDVTPSDASVTMTTIGFTQSGNTINVMAGQDVEITIKKDGYNIYKFKKTIKRTQTLSVTMELIDTLDMGQVSDEVEETIDCGTITGSVTETINAGDIYEQTIPTA